jgi:hypothetical protein
VTSSRSLSRIVPAQSGHSLFSGMILDAGARTRMKLSSLRCLDNHWIASYR